MNGCDCGIFALEVGKQNVYSNNYKYNETSLLQFARCLLLELPLQFTQVFNCFKYPILAILSFHILQSDTRIIRTKIKDELLGGFLQISSQSGNALHPQ